MAELEQDVNGIATRLRKHLPFLRQMLANLSEGCTQYNKISALCDVIGKTSKVKLATLIKCEKVITLLQTKPHRKTAAVHTTTTTTSGDVEAVPLRQANIICLAEADTTAANLTPDGIRSPSPSSTCSSIAPVLGERYEREQLSIYASAGETLDKERASKLLDALPPVDTSKPPISVEELELLKAETSVRTADVAVKQEAEEVHNNNTSNAVGQVRSKVSLVPAPFNKKARKTAAAHAVDVDVSSKCGSTSKTCLFSPKKVEKIIDGDSVFGNLLSSLDQRLIGDERKRRDSRGEEKHHHQQQQQHQRDSSQRKQLKYKLKKVEAQLVAGGAKSSLDRIREKQKQYRKQLEAYDSKNEEKKKNAKDNKSKQQQTKRKEEEEVVVVCSQPSPEPVFSPVDDDHHNVSFEKTAASSSEEGNESPFAISQIQTHASYLNFHRPYESSAMIPQLMDDTIRTPADPFNSYIPKQHPSPHARQFEHRGGGGGGVQKKDPRLGYQRWTDQRKNDDCSWGGGGGGGGMEMVNQRPFDPFAPVPVAQSAWQAYPKAAGSRWPRMDATHCRPPQPPPPPPLLHGGEHFKPFAPIGNEYDLSRMQPQDFYQPPTMPPSVPNNYRMWRELKQRDEERKRMMARSEQMDFRRMRQKENDARQSMAKKKCELEMMMEPTQPDHHIEEPPPPLKVAEEDTAAEGQKVEEEKEEEQQPTQVENEKDTTTVDPEQLLKILSEAKQKKGADGGTYLPAHVVELMESLLKTGGAATKSAEVTPEPITSTENTGKDKIEEDVETEEEEQLKHAEKDDAMEPELTSSDLGEPQQFVRNLRRRTKKINYNEVKIVNELEESAQKDSVDEEAETDTEVDVVNTSEECHPKKTPDDDDEVGEKKVRKRRGRKRKLLTPMKSTEPSENGSRDPSEDSQPPLPPAEPVTQAAAEEEEEEEDENKLESVSDLLSKGKSLKVVLHKLDVTPKRPRLARASKMGVSYEFNAMLQKGDAILDDDPFDDEEAPDDPQERSDRLQQTIDEVARNYSEKRKSCITTSPKRAKKEVKVEPHDEAPKKYAPDKNYYLRSDSNCCRLCASMGSMAQIVAHYMEDHADDEVLIARLSPIATQDAFQEAVINEYATLVERDNAAGDDNRKPSKMDYRCRFCSHDLHNELTATFFDHVSGHTGEARYHCVQCDFKHYKRLTVKTHMNRAHRRSQEPLVDDVPTSATGMLFGYICSECNYLQMRKDGVERHIARNHNTKTTYAYVINMSLPTLQRRGAPIPKTTTGVDAAPPEKSISVSPATIGFESIFDTELLAPRTRSSSRLQKLKDVEKSDASTMEIVDFDLREFLAPNCETPIQPPPPPQLKSAFVCENLDEMLKTSQMEAPVLIAPAPKRSTFLDQLKKRLEEQLPVTWQPPIDTEVTCTADMDRKEEEEEVAEKEEEKKVECKSPPTTKPPVKIEPGSPKPKPPMKLLSVSIVDAVFGKTDSVLYVCRKPACIFQTTARRVLAAHCNYTHPGDVDPLMCNVCHLQQSDPMPMITIFEHLCKHVDEYLINGGDVSSPPPPAPSSILKSALASIKREREDTEPAPKFSFKIEKVESLADTPVTESADGGAKNNNNNSVVCKLVAMTDTDAARPRKTARVIAKWIADDEMRYLFKCPQPDCDFVCTSDTFFDQHLATHAFQAKLVACLYCNFKMREEYVKMHLLMRHARSKFGCGYCLYRGLKRLYVTIHHKVMHPDKLLNIHHNEQMNIVSKYRAPMLPPIRNLVKCYKCICGKNFVLTTNFASHLKNTKTCRRCGVCEWTAPSVDALLQHATLHSVFDFVCRYCEYGDASSGNVLQHIALQHPFHDVLIISRMLKDPKEGEEKHPEIFDHLLTINEQQVKIIPDAPPSEQPPPKVVTTVTASPPDGDGGDDETAPIGDDQQLPASQLFQCSQCALCVDSSSAFLSHLSACTFNTSLAKPYECRHCKRSYKHARDLVDHMRVHGVKNLSCGLCGHKEGHQAMLRKHIKNVHKLSNIQILPMNPAKTNIDVDEFIAKPAIGQSPKTAAPSEPQPPPPPPPLVSIATATVSDASGDNSVFDASDIEKLPKMPIFKFVARCKICDYSTKVRSNFVRHMGMHATGKIDPGQPVVAPVNPVPCLEKNELMFDKMTNLAASSHVGGRMGGRTTTEPSTETSPPRVKTESNTAPQFIAVNKRYVCGATGCNYLCLEEQNLRHHLQALHDNEQSYTCVHCKEKLTRAGKSFIDIDAIVSHLRLHEAALFQCAHCDVLDNSKPKVEKHCSDKHADKPVKVITIRNRVEETEDAAGDAPKKKRIWRCGVCSCRKITEEEIRAHVAEKHSLHAKFKCMYCQFKEDARDLLDAHIAAEHPGLGADVIIGYFKEEAREKEDVKPPLPAAGGPGGETFEGFDTTPLWVKNRIGNVKHIRGILLDESEAGGAKKGKTPGGGPGRRKVSVGRPSDIPPLAPLSNTNPAESGATPEVAAAKEVIEILDDADDLEADEQSSDELNPSLSKLANMPISLLTTSNYMSTYGPLGKPNGTCYACPLCEANDIADEEAFHQHLCEELHYNRFQCMLCSAQTTTYKRMKEHYTAKHLALCDTDSVKTLQVNRSIDLWIRKVHTLQTRLIRHNREQQQQQQQKTRQGVLPRNVVPVFVCGHCRYTVMSQSELLAHSGAAHPRKKVLIQRYYK